MEWNEFLLWLHMATTTYCEKNAPKETKTCYEIVHECVLDGEEFDWCTKNWRVE